MRAGIVSVVVHFDESNECIYLYTHISCICTCLICTKEVWSYPSVHTVM